MLFSSLVFLYVFLPVVLLLVLVSLRRWHNAILLLASLFFYAWGGVSYTIILLVSILINYVCGRLIGRFRGQSRAKVVLVIGLVVNLGLLAIFKYANFLAENINSLLGPMGIEPMQIEPIALPIGISFFTFQAISYIVDVYNGRNPVQKNLPNLALYISLFPQLIAGPIVRYHDIDDQIRDRKIRWDQFASGVERFIFGLGKKVLLANNFALLADEIFAIEPNNLGTATAWIGLTCYTLQIYFDFSGYSDMAIGLGRMFGFNIPENFNFPYIARSVREFWRRWHISLSQWFRDYLYIPLGGNRISESRTYINLLIVFFLTGLWHGASWNFVFWGLFHGLFMVLERGAFGRWLDRVWWPVSTTYTLVVVMIAWVFFRSPNFGHAWGYCQALFGLTDPEFQFDLAFYLNYELITFLVIGLLASTPIFRWMHQQLMQKASEQPSNITPWIYGIGSTIFLLAIFLYCTMNLATSAYNPFIYYRF